jgi:FkbM family methyltransferase
MIFDFQEIANRIGITGIFHIGGFVGEELKSYRDYGLYNTILFEPQKNLADIINDKLEDYEQCVNLALGSKSGVMPMYISSTEGGVENGSGASSSLLKPFVHLTEHPGILFEEKVEVNLDTLDNWIYDNLAIMDVVTYNFLNIDVQGYELEVLRGASKQLEHVKGMIVEVNRDEVYQGCAKIWDIDEYLEKKGFERTKLVWQSKSWGDALYEKC